MPHDARDSLAIQPWFPRDWLSSEARAVLTPAGRSAYRDLLDAAWLAGGRLRDDDRVLQGLSGLDRGEWEAVREDVIRYFPVVEAGWRSNPRQVHEYAKAAAYRDSSRRGGEIRAANLTPERRSEIAKAAASARWKPAGCLPDASSTPASAYTPPPTPSPSPSPNEREEEKNHTSPSAPSRRRTDPLVLRLKTKLGSSTNPCLAQIRALREAGWDDARISDAIEKFAEAGMAPWDWTKKARGGDEPRRSFADERLDKLLDGMPSLTNGRVHD